MSSKKKGLNLKILRRSVWEFKEVYPKKELLMCTIVLTKNHWIIGLNIGEMIYSLKSTWIHFIYGKEGIVT